MKKCEKCNKTYSDDHAFCPDCGSSLTNIQAAPPPQNTYVNQPTQNQTPFVPIQDANWFKSWGWLPFQILGLMCEWWFNALLGAVIAIVGVMGAWNSGSNTKKGVALVLGVVAVLLFLLTLILS